MVRRSLSGGGLYNTHPRTNPIKCACWLAISDILCRHGLGGSNECVLVNGVEYSVEWMG